RESEDELLSEIPLVDQVSKIWDKQKSADAVQQVFFGHFFPLAAKIYGRDMSAEESKPLYELYELALESAKKNMNERAAKFVEQAEKSMLIEPGPLESLSQRVMAKYEETGIDIVLASMRQKEYVEDLKKFF